MPPPPAKTHTIDKMIDETQALYLSSIPLQSSSSSNKEPSVRLGVSGLIQYENIETVDEGDTLIIRSHAS